MRTGTPPEQLTQPQTAVPTQPTGPKPLFIGERIRHPKYGAGRVDWIAAEEVAGTTVEMIRFTFDDNDMTLKVPVAKINDQGIKRIISLRPYLNTDFSQVIDFAGISAKFGATWHYAPEDQLFEPYIGVSVAFATHLE